MRRLFGVLPFAVARHSVMHKSNLPRAGASNGNGESQHCHHGHGHSHGGGHGHSHGQIESSVVGKNLFDCKVVTMAGAATNIFFCGTKIWLGSSGGSVALVADGFHALTDIIADGISYFTLTVSKSKLPRCRFPFGLVKLESVGTVMVAIILLFGGVLLFVQSLEQSSKDVSNLLGHASSLESSHNHNHSHSHDHGAGAHGHSHFELTQHDGTGKEVILWSMVALAASSVICKELLYRWARRVGERAKSNVVIANAFHHRADAWSGGIALVGVAGQALGFPGVDGIAGLVVSASICKIGYTLCRDAVLDFFDFQKGAEIDNLHATLSAFKYVNPHTQELAVRAVNIFAVRSGSACVLYSTLLVSEKLPLCELNNATRRYLEQAKLTTDVDDLYFNMALCSEDTAMADSNAHSFSNGSRTNRSLDSCLSMVAQFHFVWDHMTYDVDEKVLTLEHEEGNAPSKCCMEDLRTVASMFGYALTVITVPSPTATSSFEPSSNSGTKKEQ